MKKKYLAGLGMSLFLSVSTFSQTDSTNTIDKNSNDSQSEVSSDDDFFSMSFRRFVECSY